MASNLFVQVTHRAVACFDFVRFVVPLFAAPLFTAPPRALFPFVPLATLFFVADVLLCELAPVVRPREWRPRKRVVGPSRTGSETYSDLPDATALDER